MDEPIVPTRSPERIAADIRNEVDGWIDERTEALIARGMTPEAARGQAFEEFGDRTAAERYARGQDASADRRIRIGLWLEELAADLRIAARTLLRTPAVTLVVLLTFGLGVGATTAVYSVVHAMFVRPLPYADEDRLAWLPALEHGVVGGTGLGAGRHSAVALAALRERTVSFEAIAGISTGMVLLAEGGEPEQVFGASVSGNGFEVLGARAAIGRAFTPADETQDNVVVLLHSLWTRRFGADSDVVGRSIEMSGERRMVIGVMPPTFRVPTYEAAEYLTPWDNARILRNPNNAQVRVLRLFARRKPGVSEAAAQADVNHVMRGLAEEYPRTHGGSGAGIVPIRQAVAGSARPRLLALMGASAFLLLIGCANVAGILFARAMARRHELSVRIALGAGRRRLVRQFLAEGVVLAVAGAGLGMVIAQAGIMTLRQRVDAALPAGTTFALEPWVVTFAAGTAAIAALAASLVPALAAARLRSVVLRREQGRASQGQGARRLRLGLVSGQLAIAAVLLIGTGLFARTLQRLAGLDLGYRTEGVLTFRLTFTGPRSDPEQDAFYARLYDELRGLPGVTSAGGGAVALSGSSSVIGLAIEGRAPEGGRLPDARVSPASDDYFRTLGIPLVRGRGFGPADHDSAPWAVMVSEKLAGRLWPGGDAIGARVRTSPAKPWATVVGIVGDVRMGSTDSAMPTVYTSQRQDHWPGGSTIVVRTAGDPSALLTPLREAVRRVDPAMPVIGLRTLEEFRRSTPALAERRLQVELMLVFAIVALAVSAIGVYGVSTFAMQSRRREFGIRLALGSPSRCVLVLALRDALRVAVIGGLAGVPLAWLLANRLRGMLYEVRPFEPAIVAAVLGMLLMVVFLASVAPARRATRVDPASSLREE